MTFRLDGYDEQSLATALGVPRVALFSTVTSTMDEAHRLATAGAPGGTIIVAAEQTAGRGRTGKRWSSEPGLGLWMTFIERPTDPSGLDVLSLRLGLRTAPVLEALAGARIGLKWPNDLYIGRQKLAGILVEARWRDQYPDWVAIGFGVNIVPPPDVASSVGLGGGITRRELLAALVPALRAAADTHGPLSQQELVDFADRDLARGRQLTGPAEGIASGITPDGSLNILTPTGLRQYRGGSLIFAEEAP